MGIWIVFIVDGRLYHVLTIYHYFAHGLEEIFNDMISCTGFMFMKCDEYYETTETSHKYTSQCVNIHLSSRD